MKKTDPKNSVFLACISLIFMCILFTRPLYGRTPEYTSIPNGTICTNCTSNGCFCAGTFVSGTFDPKTCSEMTYQNGALVCTQLTQSTIQPFDINAWINPTGTLTHDQVTDNMAYVRHPGDIITHATKYQMPMLASYIADAQNISFFSDQINVISKHGSDLFPNSSTVATAYDAFIASLPTVSSAPIPGKPNTDTSTQPASTAPSTTPPTSPATPPITQCWFINSFKKIYFLALQDLFNHLSSLYTNLNLFHPGVTVTRLEDISAGTQKGTHTTLDPLALLLSEKEYSLSKKTLIVNQLMNIIQTQMRNFILSVFPNLAKYPAHALTVGTSLFMNDCGIRIEYLADPNALNALFQDEKGNTVPIASMPVANATNITTSYFTALGNFLTFEQKYTNMLINTNTRLPDPATVDTFCASAQFIYDFYASIAQQAGEVAVSYKDSNPHIFFLDPTAIKGIELIAEIARELDATPAAPISWPPTLITYANTKKFIVDTDNDSQVIINPATRQPMVIAFFEDEDGNILPPSSDITTPPAGAYGLYLNLPLPGSAPYRTFYQQYLMPEPGWLSAIAMDGATSRPASANIMSIVKACLGDFWELTGAGIFNPTIEYILGQAALQVYAKTKTPLTNSFFPNGITSLNDLKDLKATAATYLSPEPPTT